MAVAVPFGIVTNILIKLGSSAFLEISSVYGVENDMRKLESTISTIKAALLDADQRQENSHLVRDWIKKLNYVVYDADDVMDAFSTKALQHELNSTDGRILNMQQVREFSSTSNSFAFRYKMGKKIKEIRERLDEIAADMRNLNFMPERVMVGARVNHEGRETHSFVVMSEVIGRDKEKEEIIQLLMCPGNQKENVSVIPIVGMGGLGKTTLAQLLYSDERVVEYFELRIWVCVSEDFETKSLVKKMLKSIINNKVADLEMDQLQIGLREKLDGKRYLLILDDVWNECPEKWIGVKNLLMGGAEGSIVVVTSRSRIVASVMSVEHLYVLEGLSEEQSWTLFEKVAFRGHEVNSKLKVIGKEIVRRCKGVPLAVRSLASVMLLKTEESDWLFIQNSDIWRDADILPILKLSYDHLPSYLKQCFAYCAIFPKDHEIKKELLIRLWMAQGYLQSPDSSQHLEEIGNHYFRDLLSRSFFQEARVDDDNNNNEVLGFKMHDLIHDLALRVAGSNCWIVERDATNISKSVRHMLWKNRGTKFPSLLLKAKGLRTLLVTGYNYRWIPHKTICKVLASKFRCLRVLDASYVVEKVPKSIGQLQHLRYLNLSWNGITSLPNSIRNLINLQTLDLSDCSRLERLPRGITKLVRLRNLMIDGCDGLNYLPRGMGKLTSLRRLLRFFFVGVGVGGKHNKSVRLSELNGLNELRGDISIEGLENVRDGESESKEANLKAKQYLHSLRLKWGGGDNSKFDDEEILLEGLQPHSELKELTIEGYSGGQMLPSWMMAISLPNIVHITLQYCDRCRHLPPFEQLPCLKVLNLTRMRRVEYQLIEDNNLNLATKSSSSSLFFPSLEELCIEELPNLKGWCTSSSREGASELLLWSQQQQQRPSFPRLTRLKISECPTLTSMPMIPHVEQLQLDRVCLKLLRQVSTTTTAAAATTTTTTTTEGFGSSSSSISSLSCPLSKRSMRISKIDDLESLPVEVFRNLEHLEITKCPRLSSCFEVSGEEGFRALPSLRSLSIWWCDSLTSLSGVTQHLTALQDLAIYFCNNFDFSGDHSLRSLLNLTIRGIPKLVSLPEGIQQVTTLQRLEITECPGLMALPDWLSNLTSLESLHIYVCPLLSERCQKETGEDWSKISHIPIIIIDYETIQGRG